MKSIIIGASDSTVIATCVDGDVFARSSYAELIFCDKSHENISSFYNTKVVFLIPSWALSTNTTNLNLQKSCNNSVQSWQTFSALVTLSMIFWSCQGNLVMHMHVQYLKVLFFNNALTLNYFTWIVLKSFCNRFQGCLNIST